MSAKKKYNVTTTGKGPQVIMFAHGYGCDQNMWRFLISAFTAEYTCVTFDYIGMGKSDYSAYDPATHKTLSGYADDVITICEEMKLKDVIFVGHSVSAMIGALASIKRPNVFSKLIMICPSACYTDDDHYTGGFKPEQIEGLLQGLKQDFPAWAAAMAPVIMGNGDKPTLGEELTNTFCRMDTRVADEFAQVTFRSDNRDDLKRVQTPTLILQCSQDVIAPEIVGEYVHKQIHDSVFIKLQATGHCPHVSAPDETLTAIKKYLAA